MHLPGMAGRIPSQPAIVVAHRNEYRHCSFLELEELSNQYAAALMNAGVTASMKVMVMVRPGVDLIAVTFALFKIRAVPVMIDPGMGRINVLNCVRQVKPEGFVGIPLAHMVRASHPAAFSSVRVKVMVGRRRPYGGPSLHALARNAPNSFDIPFTHATDSAAILFTSGSTGPPKGVVYEHGMFDAQVRMIRNTYHIQEGEIDLPAFPLFALFSTAMGMTSVIPDMNPSRPARVDPARFVRNILDHSCTSSFGSPAIWERVSRYCLKNSIRLPSLKRILIAGAPVRWQLIKRLKKILGPKADVHTPYGATESLPVASINGCQVLTETLSQSRVGGGTCVGKPLLEVAARIIRITDDPIHEWSDQWLVPNGQIGEIVVTGPMVTKQYFGLTDATALSKIYEGPRIWHRIGDVGYIDEDERIWFCGRKAHRVETEDGTMFSVPCEAVFNEHPAVYRSALVGVGPRGRQTPVIIIEPEGGKRPDRRKRAKLLGELRSMGQANELTKRVRHILFHKSFPVDVRHNVKIHREELATWAEGKLR